MAFERERRYTVIKNVDAMESLSQEEQDYLHYLCEKVAEYRTECGRVPLQCVVVESDWPEYEPTWAAIQARVEADSQEGECRIAP